MNYRSPRHLILSMANTTMSVSQLAAELRMTEAAVRKRICRGKLGPVERRHGRATVLNEDNLAAFLGSMRDARDFVTCPAAFVLARADKSGQTRPRDWRALLAAARLVEQSTETPCDSPDSVIEWRVALDAFRNRIKGLDTKLDSRPLFIQAPAVLRELVDEAVGWLHGMLNGAGA